ncbi:MAG: hypothetical protein WC880_04815 [Candidatus Paceibacterota bacterium]
MTELQPDETVQKFLISSTSRLVGEYKNDDLLITHAWPPFQNLRIDRFTEGPISRSAYAVVFRTESVEKGKGVPLPDYSINGDIICAYLSILFGKRFDNHGMTEGSGFYHLPELSQYQDLSIAKLSQNNHLPRKNFEIPLNLVEFKRIERLFLDDSLDQKFRDHLDTAGKFYLNAMRDIERNPEAAYLHLITAGEVLSNFYDYDSYTLLDEATKKTIKEIKALQGGEELAKQINYKLRQIKRRFLKSTLSLINDEFFLGGEASNEHECLKKEDFEDQLAAAYDLRSIHLHSGLPFGSWISPMNWGNNEVHFGEPVVEDRDLGKALAKAPTFCGLERTIRFALLRFIQTEGFPIDLTNDREYS